MACSLSNDYIFKIGPSGSEAVIAGQLDCTLTVGGAPVETTNKASGGYIEYCPDFVAGKQIVFAGTFTLTDEANQNSVKDAIENGTLVAGNVISASGAEEWQCDTWSISGRSDAAPVNGVTQMSVNIMTSGVYTYTSAS